MEETPIITRKHDTWLVPATIVLILSVLGMMGNWGRWTSTVEADIRKNTEITTINRKHIEMLETNYADSRVADAEIVTQMNSVSSQIEKLSKKQDILLEHLIP